MSVVVVFRSCLPAVFGGLALALAGCASGGAPAIDPSLIRSNSGGGGSPDRPAFFVQWQTGGLPGLTQRPSLDRASRLPDYPQQSIRNREEGTTTLEACVTAEGRLVDVKVARSSGHSNLDEATVTWARTARYKPAMFNNEAFAVCGYRLDWVWQFEEPAN
jgi:TonB family protein